MNTTVKALFESVFGGAAELEGFAPGRVNLIGEHTDYNGGRVFPCALNLGIFCAARKRGDNTLRFYSQNFPDDGIIDFSLGNLRLCNRWTDYPVAVIKTFAAMGYEITHGAELAFCGNLPDGSGLSSSAALEVLTGVMLKGLYGFSVTAQELAVFGQFAENRFIGVNCGIMDQFASAMGKKDCALLLDTATLALEYAPVPQNKAAVVIVNSGVKHSLASSAYNDRRRECETALAQINEVRKTPSLCALTPDEFEALQQTVTDSVCRRRAKHAVYENARVTEAANALKNGDVARFGELMKQSHVSLRDDYEVSCEELDFLAECAWNMENVLGARMTGGGFGGCTVNLVQPGSVDRFMKTIQTEYQKQFGKTPAVYTAQISGGAALLPTDKG